MNAIKQEWRPQPDVTDHTGNRLPENRVFFVPPPLEIGHILSAYSSVVCGKMPNPIGRRLAIGAVLAAIAIGIVRLNVRDFNLSFVEGMEAMLIFGGLAGLLGFLISNRANFCSYVGEQGVARYKLKKDPEQTRQGKVFLFQNAAELRTAQIRNNFHGAYTSTSYDFSWSDAKGKQVFLLSGRYRSEKGTPKAGDAFYFVRASEAAWSTFVFERAKAELARIGTIRFNLLGSNHLLIGPGFLEICDNGQTTRCHQHEIARIALSRGVVTLRRTDAWSGVFGIGSIGIFSFDYSYLGNAQLFRTLLKDMVGVEFS
ncbi:MAG TPA: hypothetical protein VKU00_17300 [Chthonomonadaceae bacterium]|nr:hypothetical protein [Chthonomonadaceae bacterium]